MFWLDRYSVAAVFGLETAGPGRFFSTGSQSDFITSSALLVYLGFAWWRASPELDLWLGRLRRRG